MACQIYVSYASDGGKMGDRPEWLTEDLRLSGDEPTGRDVSSARKYTTFNQTTVQLFDYCPRTREHCI